jgi:uncharacterized protein (DUF885 family)
MSRSDTTSAIAGRYIEDLAALDPIEATEMGVAGHDHELTDYSEDGCAARAELRRRTLAELRTIEPANAGERLATAVMEERLTSALEQHEAGERLRDVRVLGSPIQSVRSCFDLMAYETEADWETAARRMEAVPDALTSIVAALERGREVGDVAARRQAEECARQCEVWGGATDDEPFFVDLARRGSARNLPESLRRRLDTAAESATDAYAALSEYLRETYAPAATDVDAVGPDRYALFLRAFLGAEPDVEEAYAWGWEELHRIEHAMREVADRILPGESIDRVVEHLDRDPNRRVEGADALRVWLQDLLDRTIAELDGVHFDIPERVKRVEAMIAPPGGAAAMYYTPPSEDFSRPGRTWYPTLGATSFPLWHEVSTCYHEGVPGHHLQIGQVVHLQDTLTRFQRLQGFTSGHGEGWALYAERLMGELGYLDDPADELGMLAAHALRAARVVIDIGLHLGFAIPEGEDGADTGWTWDVAYRYLRSRGRLAEGFARSEVDRYLGLPAQAISYKIGERVWLRCREDARRRHGDEFDLKAWHGFALDLGGMGLDTLERELARF